MRFVKTGSPQDSRVPLHPDVRVSTRSSNPVALIAAVRHELRRAGVDSDEIRRFSSQALSIDDAQRRLEVCRKWVYIQPAPSEALNVPSPVSETPLSCMCECAGSVDQLCL